MSGQVSMVTDPPAVELVEVCHSYGRGKSNVKVLRRCNMTVPKGAIYGLLGPSGCGKTTLLKCIIGRLDVDSGHVVTLGKTPGSLGHEVPGRRVGYMPQELALYLEFTIGETLSYFGRLHQMDSSEITQRTEFLLEFLNLPAKGRKVNQLSGGQQRRVSFSIALLQEPELLILDEPTVGVDPLLRERIWQHLLKIVERYQTTIIITTHYIEEARQAHQVGLMRGGKMLAEQPPELLLRQHHTQSLEEVFLKLCKIDQVGDIEEEEAEPHQLSRPKFCDDSSTEEERAPLLEDEVEQGRSSLQHSQPTPETLTCSRRCHLMLPSFWNFLALSIKNLIIMKRKVGLLVFEFFIPSVQIILFCLCIGRTPSDLPMAVFNAEHPAGASTAFLSQLDNTTLIQKNYPSMEAAISSVEAGSCWGVIDIGRNFTADLIKRFTLSSRSLDNATIEGSTVYLHLDMSNQQIYLTIEQAVVAGFQRFTKKTLSSMGCNPDVADIPVQLAPPVYGDLNPSFTNFIAPGIILSITFFMATGLTALSFVLERKQGLLDRSYTAGVTPIEVMFAHTGTQFLILIGQVALLLIFTLAVFKVPYQGPLILVVLLTLMQGFTGMALGLLISAFCEEENTAIQCALGSVYPNMLLSGIIWPIQGMPLWLRYVSYGLPMTLAADAMRNVLARGWDLTYSGVYYGFLTTVAWGAFFLIFAGITLQIKAR